MLRISTVNGHQRMSTQDLLQKISDAVASGETEFYIAASGQHDIGGPYWNSDGRLLQFTVVNPGQRAGSMCLPNTKIIIEGSAPADVGWLNSGGIVAVKGDAGDTAGHCAASGKIYIGGRAGTRTGSLMKHDPQFPEPELWVLNSVGSFSFEFMGGGKAVVCGHDSQTLQSVLGDRPCIGMVGGAVYFRGPCSEIPPDVEIAILDETDIAWLESGIEEFLQTINQSRLKKELTLWKHWRKLVPAKAQMRPSRKDVATFRQKSWITGGLFGDVLEDDFQVSSLVGQGRNRILQPCRSKDSLCTDCKMCVKACPQAAIRRRKPGDETQKPVYSVEAERCIGCGFCAAICPASVWKMESL